MVSRRPMPARLALPRTHWCWLHGGAGRDRLIMGWLGPAALPRPDSKFDIVKLPRRATRRRRGGTGRQLEPGHPATVWRGPFYRASLGDLAALPADRSRAGKVATLLGSGSIPASVSSVASCVPIPGARGWWPADRPRCRTAPAVAQLHGGQSTSAISPSSSAAEHVGAGAPNISQRTAIQISGW